MKTVAFLLLLALPSAFARFGLLRVDGPTADRVLRPRDFGHSAFQEDAKEALRELMYWGGLGSGMSMSMSMPTDSADDSDSSVPPLPDANATLVPDVTNTTGADDNTTATPSDMPSDMPSDVPSAVPTMSPTVATTSATTIAPTGTDIGAAGANGNTSRGGGSNQRAEKGKIAGVTITLLVAAAVCAALFARKVHKNSASSQSMSDSSDSDQDGMA